VARPLELIGGGLLRLLGGALASDEHRAGSDEDGTYDQN